MGDRGFTLVELLAVVTIIALITVVAVPSALTFQNNMKKKMFCSKIETIESAARHYGNDLYNTIEADDSGDLAIELSARCLPTGKKGHCLKVNISMLMSKKYLKKEVNTVTGEKNQYYDPRNFRTMVNDQVLVYMDSKRIYARYIFNNKSDLRLCNPQDETDSNKKLYYKRSGGNIIQVTGGTEGAFN